MQPQASRADFQRMLDSLFDPAKSGRERVFTKQRCVNVLGRDVACVQDSATVQPHPFLLFGGLALLLWIAK